MSLHRENPSVVHSLGQSLGLSFLQTVPNEDTYMDNRTITPTEWHNCPSGSHERYLHSDQYQSYQQQCISDLHNSTVESTYENFTPEITEFLNEQSEKQNTTTYGFFSPSIGLPENLNYKGIMHNFR